jgi:pyruvate/2-oxoglutarate dehydrogenase complex dihydrolipoamide dehydrogenase (E3) component
MKQSERFSKIPPAIKIDPATGAVEITETSARKNSADNLEEKLAPVQVFENEKTGKNNS